MTPLEQGIREFEQRSQVASDYVDTLSAAEPNITPIELEDAYYAKLQDLYDNTQQYYDDLFAKVTDSAYFTQKFVNLEPQRKIEELSTQLLTVLAAADALTDANINIVDRIVALREEVA
jgi:hypothetical protein